MVQSSPTWWFKVVYITTWNAPLFTARTFPSLAERRLGLRRFIAAINFGMIWCALCWQLLPYLSNIQSGPITSKPQAIYVYNVNNTSYVRFKNWHFICRHTHESGLNLRKIFHCRQRGIEAPKRDAENVEWRNAKGIERGGECGKMFPSQPTGGLGSVVSSPSGVRGRAPVANEFGAYWGPEKASGGKYEETI